MKIFVTGRHAKVTIEAVLPFQETFHSPKSATSKTDTNIINMFVCSARTFYRPLYLYVCLQWDIQEKGLKTQVKIWDTITLTVASR